jgi:hypothetical protein
VTWNYVDPNRNDRDKVRFLIGDTCEDEPQVTDEEIAFALTEHPVINLAAARVLRAMAAKWSRLVSSKVGDIGISNAAAVSKSLSDRANELDPGGVTKGGLLALPSFGGLSKAEKQTLDENEDAVQPMFRKGMNDIPGGPGDLTDADYDDDLLS